MESVIRLASKNATSGPKCAAGELEAFKYYYAPAGGGLGVAGICTKSAPEIVKLQADVIAAAKPFMLETGPSARSRHSTTIRPPM